MASEQSRLRKEFGKAEGALGASGLKQVHKWQRCAGGRTAKDAKPSNGNPVLCSRGSGGSRLNQVAVRQQLKGKPRNLDDAVYGPTHGDRTR